MEVGKIEELTNTKQETFLTFRRPVETYNYEWTEQLPTHVMCHAQYEARIIVDNREDLKVKFTLDSYGILVLKGECDSIVAAKKIIEQYIKVDF